MTSGLRKSLKSWPTAFSYARPQRRLISASTILLLIGAAATLAEPWPLALMVDSVLGDSPMPGPLEALPTSLGFRIVFAAVLTLLIALVVNGAKALAEYVNTKLEMRIVLDFRSRLFQHVQRLSFAYHDNRRTGEFMGRINSQAMSLGSVVRAVYPLLHSALLLIGMFLVAFKLNALVAVLSLAVVPFIYYSAGYYGTRIGPAVRRVKGMEMKSLHIVLEAMQMIRVTAAFGREGHEFRKFRDQGEEAVDARVKLTVRQTLFTLVVSLITVMGTAAVLGVGAWQVIEGNLTVGRLLVLMNYIARVYQPLETLSKTVNTLQYDLIGFELALELLDTPPDIKDRPGARKIERAAGDVRFDGVHFAYGGRNETLTDISFEAAPGTAVAVVGPTGAGKTTLVSLIPRFYDPQRGRVLLDGTDIRDISLQSLRRQMSIVLQEPLLFTGTIAENIQYGRLGASHREIVQAARAANAHDFITALPQKYKTKLGERGAKLSGGERQRLCIARAFLRNSPILILDEPTSSVDSKTEGEILEALERLMEGRTTFMIAHRLSTVRSADMTLVLNNGRIVEQGTHAELLRAGGLYRQLYDLQHGADPTSVEVPPAAVADLFADLTRDVPDNGDRDGARAQERRETAQEVNDPADVRATLYPLYEASLLDTEAGL